MRCNEDRLAPIKNIGTQIQIHLDILRTMIWSQTFKLFFSIRWYQPILVISVYIAMFGLYLSNEYIGSWPIIMPETNHHYHYFVGNNFTITLINQSYIDQSNYPQVGFPSSPLPLHTISIGQWSSRKLGKSTFYNYCLFFQEYLLTFQD